MNHEDALRCLAMATQQTWLNLACVAEEQEDHATAAMCLGHLVAHHSIVNAETIAALFKHLSLAQNPTKVLEGIGPALRFVLRHFVTDNAPTTPIHLNHDRTTSLELLQMYSGAQANHTSNRNSNHGNGNVKCLVILSTIPQVTLGFCLVANNRLHEAHAAFRSAAGILRHEEPPCNQAMMEDHYLLWLGLGVMFFKHNSLKQALDTLSRCSKIQGFARANEAMYFLGLIHKRQLKRILALECFHAILDQAPQPLTRCDIMFEIGHVHELHNEPKLAKQVYQQIMNLSTSDAKRRARALARFGWVCSLSRSLRLLTVAQESIENAIDTDADDVVAWVMLIRVRAKSQSPHKAVLTCLQAIEHFPHSALVWCDLGSFYYHHNQFSDAAFAFEKATHHDPAMGEAWFNLGITLQRQEKFEQAIIALEHALTVNIHPYINKQIGIVRKLLQAGGRDEANDIPQPLVPCVTNPLLHTRNVAMPDINI
eukprot:c12950_g3_i2.p1 GENE.c12950_g3_i2~~c12950_g3_i2.p1  ORF type:complete len:483 (+),score=123.55 c12950_g3_i2:184-1632(+)